MKERERERDWQQIVASLSLFQSCLLSLSQHHQSRLFHLSATLTLMSFFLSLKLICYIFLRLNWFSNNKGESMRTFSIHICTSAVPSSLSGCLSLANGSLSMLFFLQRLPYLWCWWLVKAARFTKTFQVGIINKRSFFFLYQSINNISINDLSVKHSVVSLRRVPLGPTQKNSEAKKRNRKRELGQFWTGFKSSAQVVKTNAVAQARILVMVKFYTTDIILL